jgi:hypothetical protein
VQTYRCGYINIEIKLSTSVIVDLWIHRVKYEPSHEKRLQTFICAIGDAIAVAQQRQLLLAQTIEAQQVFAGELLILGNAQVEEIDLRVAP